MTLCVFALIASEFAGQPADTDGKDPSCHRRHGRTGHRDFRAFAVVTNLFISVLAGTLNRKTLLLGLTCIMAISGAVIAMAPNYLTYMAGRA
jgi:hypothetical protein